MRKAALLVLLLATLTAAGPLDSSQHRLNASLSNTVIIQPQVPNYEVVTVEARLSWYPRGSYRQELHELTFTPEGDTDDGDKLFRWDRPIQKELDLGFTSTLTSTDAQYPVKDDHAYPVTPPQKYRKYLRSQEITNVNDDIRRHAAVITHDADTVYEAATQLAYWVEQNINYSLTTLTEEASKPSSWVLREGRGVCDELTSLFISMARSQGIPARFAYGHAYTNIQEQWGPHGWAEVYIPDEGWVPFDPTYGLYGQLTGTHIKMGDSLDANKPTIRYRSRARDATLRNGPVEMNVDSITARNRSPGLSVEVSPRLQTIGLNGSNVIEATIVNQEPIYKAVKARLVAPQRFSDRSQALVLGPNEERTVAWQLNSTDLRPGYSYRFPVQVRAGKASASTSFDAEQGAPSTTLAPTNTTLPEPTLECTARPGEVLVNQSTTITCNASIGYCRNCTRTRSFQKTGMHRVQIQGFTGRKNATGSAMVSVVDTPDIDTVVDAPTRANVNGQTIINVNITPTSLSTPENVSVTLRYDGRRSAWNYTRLDATESIQIQLDTAGLRYNNPFNLSVEWHGRNTTQRTRKDFVIIGTATSLSDRAKLFLNWLVHAIRSLTKL